MKIRPIIAIRQALSQIGRNIAMTFASLFSITAILLILGIFFIVVVNINSLSQSVKENYGTVQINLLDTTDEAASAKMMDSLKTLQGVDSVTYQTKEQALQSMKIKWGDNGYLLDSLEVNPLPNGIIIHVSNLTDAQHVVDVASKFQGIDKINYAQDMINKLIKVTNAIQLGALILIVCLLIISIIVVSNTIKLTVIAREREITIMKYIGATNWFIRGPFLIEGMIMGLVSALISGGLVALIYHAIVKNYGLGYTLIMSTGLVSQHFLIKNLFIIFIALGISIGACGSIISMRRFLDR